MNLNLNNNNEGKTILLFLFLIAFNLLLNAQSSKAIDSTVVPVKDIGDIIKKIFKKKGETAKPEKQPGYAILPSLGYNPSLGFVVGAKLSGSKQYGNLNNTELSVFELQALYTTKGILTAQARHNIFSEKNKWNWQGNWQISKFGIIDYGVGTGNNKFRSPSFGINEFPIENSDSAFPIKYDYIRFFEKVYRKIMPNFYAGGGISLDMYAHINDEKLSATVNSPHQQYSVRNGFDTKKYTANGFLLAVQYNSLEHPIRSYGGMYADVSVRVNQKWMGSTKNSVQLQYEFKKFWSVSKTNPEQVIAFWHWASYKLNGSLPYLEMPSTASDTYNRSGRAYTLSRFKGPSFSYVETEYRFPITRNKLLSGVCFINMQSASDDIGRKIFRYWEPGAGAGLRILFQKESRTSLCIDLAKGNYGSSGVFFGLREVF